MIAFDTVDHSFLPQMPSFLGFGVAVLTFPYYLPAPHLLFRVSPHVPASKHGSAQGSGLRVSPLSVTLTPSAISSRSWLSALYLCFPIYYLQPGALSCDIQLFTLLSLLMSSKQFNPYYQF